MNANTVRLLLAALILVGACSSSGSSGGSDGSDDVSKTPPTVDELVAASRMVSVPSQTFEQGGYCVTFAEAWPRDVRFSPPTGPRVLYTLLKAGVGDMRATLSVIPSGPNLRKWPPIRAANSRTGYLVGGTIEGPPRVLQETVPVSLRDNLSAFEYAEELTVHYGPHPVTRVDYYIVWAEDDAWYALRFFSLKRKISYTDPKLRAEILRIARGVRACNTKRGTENIS